MLFLSRFLKALADLTQPIWREGFVKQVGFKLGVKERDGGSYR